MAKFRAYLTNTSNTGINRYLPLPGWLDIVVVDASGKVGMVMFQPDTPPAGSSIGPGAVFACWEPEFVVGITAPDLPPLPAPQAAAALSPGEGCES